MAYDVELVLDAKARLGEGPIWDHVNNVLLWVNILENEVHIYDPATGSDRHLLLPDMPGTIVPRACGGAVVALPDQFAALDLHTGALTKLADVEKDNPATRCNDGKCDPQGRLWTGTMPISEDSTSGTMYRLDPDHSIRPIFDGITISNGLCWSSDQSTMYYIDTPTFNIDAFDFDPGTGSLSNRRTVVKIPEENQWPDGMTIDVEGKLWVGHWGGWHCCRYDPETGERLARVKMPCSNVTACAFGDPDFSTLYITTASERVEDIAEQPLAGGLFKVDVGVAGSEQHAYAG